MHFDRPVERRKRLPHCPRCNRDIPHPDERYRATAVLDGGWGYSFTAGNEALLAHDRNMLADGRRSNTREGTAGLTREYTLNGGAGASSATRNEWVKWGRDYALGCGRGESKSGGSDIRCVWERALFADGGHSRAVGQSAHGNFDYCLTAEGGEARTVGRLAHLFLVGDAPASGHAQKRRH
jgi:hypothetical protein